MSLQKNTSSLDSSPLSSLSFSQKMKLTRTVDDHEMKTTAVDESTTTTITVEDLMDLILPELLTEFPQDTLKPYILQLENTPWLLNKKISNFDEFLDIITKGTLFFPDLKILVNSIVLKASKIFSFITNDDDENDDDNNKVEVDENNNNVIDDKVEKMEL